MAIFFGFNSPIDFHTCFKNINVYHSVLILRSICVCFVICVCVCDSPVVNYVKSVADCCTDFTRTYDNRYFYVLEFYAILQMALFDPLNACLMSSFGNVIQLYHKYI